MTAAIIPIVVEQHAEESAFLWLLRDAAVSAPHYRLKDLVKLDGRVEAHIDGLRIAGDEGWRFCCEALALKAPGEVFAAGVLALDSRDPARLDQVFAVAEAAPETVRGLISAFGWVAPQHLQGTVKTLLAAREPLRRRIGIAACAVHRVNPGAAVDAAVTDSDPDLQARALRAAGELGRKDLLRVLFQHVRAEDEGCRFWAAWSAVLLGDRRDGLDYLKAVAASASIYRERALQLVLRVMDSSSARAWLKGFMQYPDWLRYVVMGAGITGEPVYVPWLIKQMAVPELMRIAGEAFSVITGVDLSYADLEGKRPEGFEAGPTENPEDENVNMDNDENLHWPDPELVQNWWESNKDRFQAGRRYLLGRLIASEGCEEALLAGYQRQRMAAALELTLLQPGTPLFETRAPGWRQERLLKTLNRAT